MSAAGLLGRLAALLTALCIASAAWGAPQREPRLALWRLDCGTFDDKHLVDSCYLVRHDARYLLWDAGFGAELKDHPGMDAKGSRLTLRRTLAEQLAELRLTPARIDLVALSHGHFDHIGQADSFPDAELLIGKADWEALTAAPLTSEGRRVAPWARPGAPVRLITGDLDVFGDGSVVMLATPGHTAGHHSLLVRLPISGPILLTGDLYATEAQRTAQTPGRHDPDPAAARASFARFEALARLSGAVVVVQHDPADVARLPAFPAAAH